MECVDFLEFQDRLKKMRDLDDKLTYALNVSVPSPSFRSEIRPENTCKELFDKLKENYEKREKAIRNCIDTSSNRVDELRQLSASGDSSVSKMLAKEQTKLRLLRSELNVEEIVKERSLKLLYERCREFFKPPSVTVE